MVTIGSKQNGMQILKISKGSSSILSDMLAAYDMRHIHPDYGLQCRRNETKS